MKVFSVQEIWGDGDSWPTLTGLKLFATKSLAEKHCKKVWEKTLKGTVEIYKDNEKQKLKIVDDSDKVMFDCSYGKFCAFLIKEMKIIEMEGK